jgi:hypothetical protein
VPTRSPFFGKVCRLADTCPARRFTMPRTEGGFPSQGLSWFARCQAPPKVSCSLTESSQILRRVFWLRVNLIDPPLNERMERFRGQRPRPANVVSCLEEPGPDEEPVTVSI